MKRRTLLLLLVGLLVGVGAYGVWSVVRQAVWDHSLIHAGASARQLGFIHAEEAPERWLDGVVLVDDQDAGTATLYLLAGTGAVDEAMRERFDRPLPAHPCPAPGRVDYARFGTPRDVISADDERGRTIELVRMGHGWLVDLRPLEVEGVTVEEARVMRERLDEFAAQIEAGAFTSYDAALAEYGAAGLWKGFDPAPAGGPDAGIVQP